MSEDLEKKIASLERALKRERSARKEAESILEQKALELFKANEALRSLNSNLETEVSQRTAEIEMLAQLQSESPFPILRANALGEIIFSNKAGDDIIVKLDKENQDSIHSFIHKKVSEALVSGVRCELELQLGKRFYLFTLAPVVERQYVNIYVSDFSDRKRFENELRRSEEKYRSIIENIRLGLLEVDNEGVVTSVDARFCEMSGYDFGELVGQDATNLLADESFKKTIAEQNEKRLAGQKSAYEVKIRRKDGGDVWLLISGAPLYNSNDEIVGSIGIHLDITEGKLIQEQLVRERERAEDSMRSKERFLANMSHEIRTPINAILGMARILSKETLSKKQVNYLNTIIASGESLKVIINDILDLSKIEAGEMVFESVDFHLGSIIESVVGPLRLKAEEKDVLVTSEIDERILPWLKSDPVRLSQVLFNVLGNAIKFTKQGRVDLSIGLMEETESHQVILFQVTDTGIGMSTDEIMKIFQPFKQADDGTTRKFGGTGLGLSITRTLVDMFGGQISVESEPGVGSVFAIELPMRKGETPEGVIPVVDDDYVFGDLNILVAEDNSFNQLLVRTLLNQVGLEHTIVNNGKEAIEAIQYDRYDLVLMDIQMPEMGGIQATYVLRNEYNCQLPIVALTANAISGDREKFLNAGMDDYLAKPFEEKELFRLISKWAPNAILAGPVEEENAMEQVENPQVPLYGTQKLNGMLGGNQEMVGKLMDSFLEHTPPVLADIQTALEKEDFPQLSDLAHRLKASYNSFEIDSMESVLLDLEHQEDKKTREALTPLVHQLLQVSHEVLEGMKEERASS